MSVPCDWLRAQELDDAIALAREHGERLSFELVDVSGLILKEFYNRLGLVARQVGHDGHLLEDETSF